MRSNSVECTARHVLRRAVCLGLVAFAPVILEASGCSSGDGILEPSEPNGPGSPPLDVTSPAITNLQPGSNVILNDTSVTVTVSDPPGPNGATPSSILPAGITARRDDGVSVLVTNPETSMFSADISGWKDGPHAISWSAVDIAGNAGTVEQSFTIDRTAPKITFIQKPPATTQSGDRRLSWTVEIAIEEEHLNQGQFAFSLAGEDGVCETGDEPWPDYDQPIWVSESPFLSAGINLRQAEILNPLLPGSSPVTVAYCGRAHADDSAVTRTRTSNSNSASSPSFRTEVVWSAPDFGYWDP